MELIDILLAAGMIDGAIELAKASYSILPALIAAAGSIASNELGGAAARKMAKGIASAGNAAYNQSNALIDKYNEKSQGNMDSYTANTDDALGSMRLGIDEGNEFSKNALNAMGTEADVNKYLNPKMDAMLEKAANMVRGGAGGMLQSSATSNAVADRVAGMAGEMWDKAQGVSMQKGQSGIGLGQNMAGTALQQGKSTADIYNTGFQNQQGIYESGTQAQLDAVAAKQAADIAAAQAKGQDKSIGGLFS